MAARDHQHDEPVGAAGAYDAMAEAYALDGEENAYNALYERPATLALLPPVQGRDVLDVGCGAGPLSARLAEAGARVTGFDASERMVALARARALQEARFLVADLAAPLPFDDDAFDVAVASLVLHYLRDWVAPLRELRRVVRPGGALVCSTHHPADDVALSSSGDYFATELLHDRWEKGGREYDVRFWRRPLHAMFASFDAAGWRVERLEEPQPLPACRERDPEAWRRLTREPAFLFFRLVPVP
ncbi:class I SAM-dependent methyltransferase [Conexibacter arvalis]|uniref:SAM-dependent methyltransferase n=1 Tax=Conexibacter arvalis TaxID=912552 RepID=A0A840I980_9ACTN|nr:class I SAM-dependent methyltransferase [Conexibacter arvalis]MBB4660821.1 SAM-dependent methyltransferase [Conexibacter arvalis]